MKNFLGSPIQGATRAAATPPGSPPMTPALATSIGAGKAGKSFDISDFKQYFHVIVKRIWLVTLCFIIAVAVAVVSLLRQVPYYRCTAVVQISRGSPLPGMPSQTRSSGADYYAVQESVLRSSTLRQRATERMQMPGAELQAQIRGMSVYTDRGTARISISIESYEPVIGSRFANVLAEEFIDFRNEQRIDESQNNVIDLTQKANRIRDELRKAEEKLQAYRQANNLLFSSENQGNFAAAQVRSLELVAAQVRNERMLLQAQQPFFADASDDIVLRSLLGETPTSAVATNSVSNKGPEALIERNLVESAGWSQIQRQRAQLQSRIAAMQAKFTDNHPDMVRAVQEMADLDRRLEVELQFAMEEFQSKIDTLTIKEKAIGQVKLDWEEKARAIASKEDELSLYRKNVGRLESLYEVIFNKLKDVEISFGSDTETLQIMERARPAGSPVSSRPVQIIFLAALIGIVVGVVLVFGLEYIDDSIRYPEEVGDILGMPFFGVIPSANWDPDDLNSHMLSNIDQKSGLSEAYRNVRSAMLFSGAVKKGIRAGLHLGRAEGRQDHDLPQPFGELRPGRRARAAGRRRHAPRRTAQVLRPGRRPRPRRHSRRQLQTRVAHPAHRHPQPRPGRHRPLPAQPGRTAAAPRVHPLRRAGQTLVRLRVLRLPARHGRVRIRRDGLPGRRLHLRRLGRPDLAQALPDVGPRAARPRRQPHRLRPQQSRVRPGGVLLLLHLLRVLRLRLPVREDRNLTRRRTPPPTRDPTMFDRRGISARAVALVMMDVAVMVSAMALSHVLRFGMWEGLELFIEHIPTISGSCLIFATVFFAAGLYEGRVLSDRRQTFWMALAGTLIALVIIILVFYARYKLHFGRGILFVAALLILGGVVALRSLYRLVVGHGFFARPTLIVGEGPDLERVVRLLRRGEGASAYRVFGIVRPAAVAGGGFVDGIPVLGGLSQLREFVNAYDINTIVLATPLPRESTLLSCLRPLRYAGVRVMDFISLHEELDQSIPVDHINDEWLMHASMNSSRLHVRKIKRMVDVAVSLLGLLLTAPLSALVALAVRLDSPGPVVFRQRRSGLDGKPYNPLQIPHHAPGRRAGNRRRLGRPQRPARHPHRPLPAHHAPRRNPAAPQRAARRHEPRRTPPGTS
jgi:uncharacterized protein involved in exopolysaccharide biosynthesis